jgi:hypothetical protein
MLIAIYLILLIGGMLLVGFSFGAPMLQGLIFMAGVLVISAAVAVPIVAQRLENRPAQGPRR